MLAACTIVFELDELCAISNLSACLFVFVELSNFAHIIPFRRYAMRSIFARLPGSAPAPAREELAPTAASSSGPARAAAATSNGSSAAVATSVTSSGPSTIQSIRTAFAELHGRRQKKVSTGEWDGLQRSSKFTWHMRQAGKATGRERQLQSEVGGVKRLARAFNVDKLRIGDCAVDGCRPRPLKRGPQGALIVF